jgi:hypothetical protein
VVHVGAGLQFPLEHPYGQFLQLTSAPLHDFTQTPPLLQ